MAISVYTEEMYQALCAAIAQGATSVKYGDKQVDYRTLPEMERIKGIMEVALGKRKPNRRKYFSHTKGLQ